MWSNYAYNVGGLLFTLDEIEHGVLRCNRGHPKDQKPMFSDEEARESLALNSLDPRIHFALNCGATSCPPIRFLLDIWKQLCLLGILWADGRYKIVVGHFI